MLQVSETNTYALATAAEAQVEAWVDAVNEEFSRLSFSYDREGSFSLETQEALDRLEQADGGDTAQPSSLPTVYTVMTGAMVTIIDPAVVGTSLGAAGIQYDPHALGMHRDSSEAAYYSNSDHAPISHEGCIGLAPITSTNATPLLVHSGNLAA